MQDVLSIYGILSYHGKDPNCNEKRPLRFGVKVAGDNVSANEAEKGEVRDKEGKQRKGCSTKAFKFFLKKKKRGSGPWVECS